MPVAVGSTPVTAIYHGSTLIADLRHASQQITIGGGATVPDAPTNVGVTVSDLSAPDAPTGVGVVASDQYDDLYDDVVLLLQDSLTDESPQGQTVAAIGDAAISTTLAKVGTSSFSFDGNGDYLNIANDPAFEFGTGDFTIEAWVYLEGYTDSQGHSILGASTNGGIMLASLNGDLRIGRNLVAWDHTVNGVLTAQTWHHVAVSRSSGTLRMFVDGVEVLSAANSISYGLAGGTLFLGGRKGFSVAITNFWHGTLDAIRFTSAARYTANFTPPTAAFPTSAPPPTTDPHFSEVTLLLQDSLVDGSLREQAVVANGNAQISTTESKFGGSSIYLDGNGDWLEIADSTDFDLPGDFTVECWFYPTASSGTFARLWSFGNYNAANSMTLSFANDGSADQGRIYLDFNGPQTFTAAGLVSLDTWQHASVSRSGSTVRVFLDGIERLSITSNAAVQRNQPFIIGNLHGFTGNNLTAFSGYIDDFRITKGVGRYETNFTPPTAAFPTAGPVDDSFSDVVLLLKDSLTDNSLQGQTVVSVNGASFTTANPKFGTNSLDIVSSGHITTSAFPFGTGDYTLEMWFYQTASAYQPFLYAGHPHTANGSLWVTADVGSGGGLTVGVAGGGTAQQIKSQVVPTLNQWNHFAVCRESGTTKIFLNGTLLISSAAHSGVNLLEAAPEFGNESSTNRRFPGYLDDIRVTKGAARYTANFTPPTSAFPATNGDPQFGSVSLLLQDSLTDESLEGQTIVINGNTQIDTAVKRYGTGSISMQANGDTLQMTVDSSLDFSGQFTVEAWVRTTTSSGYRTLWCHRRSATNSTDIFVLFFDTSTTLKAGIITDQFAVNASSILDGDWHHIAMVRDSTHLRLYLDGVQGGSTPSSATLSAIGLPFYIGTDQYYPSRNFIGHMDDIRITNGIARYPNGTTFTPPTAPFPN